MPSVCSQVSFCPKSAGETHAVDNFAFTTFSLHTSWHFAVERDTLESGEGTLYTSWHFAERAPLLEFVESTRKAFAAVKASF